MRNTVVVDTSIAIKWVLNEPDSDIAQALLVEWIDRGVTILAPSLLAYEVANVLHQNVRRKEITREEAKKALRKVLLSELEIDFSSNLDLGIQALELADQYNLPAAYDAHYLALAEREGCELWTADTRLWNSIKGKFSWARWMGDYQPTNQHTSPNESDNS